MRVAPLLVAAASAALLLSPAARADDVTPPVITHKAPAAGSLPKGKPFTVTAKIIDESKFFPQIFFRYGPGAYEKPVDMRKAAGAKDMWEADVPYKGDTVDYYIEAYDEFGNGPARSGDPDAPFRVKLGAEAPPPPPPVAKAAPAPSQAPASSASSSSLRPAPMGATASAGGSKGRTWTWVTGGVGLGLLTGGLLAGLAVKSADDAIALAVKGNPSPGGGSTVGNLAALREQADANKSLGTKATILTIAGGALLATGVALYFVEGGSSGSKGDDGSGFIGAKDSAPAPVMFGAAPVEGGAAVAVAGRF